MYIKTTPEILELVTHLPNKDSFLYFTYQLINKNAYNQGVYLDSQRLKATFGDKDYKQIVDGLIHFNIITRMKNYGSGFPYYTYKLSIKKDNKALIEYQLTNQKLINSINYIKESNYTKLPSYVKKMGKNLDDLIITPELLEVLVADGIQLEDKYWLTKNKAFENRISQPKGDRVFHTLTSMKKKYRVLLGHKKGNLVEIDAKNAQLIFLSQLCTSDKQFNKDVFDGVFYENLAKKMGFELNEITRSDFKMGFYNTIMCNENKAVISNNKYSEAFLELYPEIYNYLLSFESDKTKASTLQGLESDFFIKNIARDLVEAGVWCVTVHDAIIILETDIDSAIGIIKDHSMSFFNQQITTSFTAYQKCSTPCTPPLSSTLHIENKVLTIEQPSREYICSVETQGGVQNKNTVKSVDTIDKIKSAIILLQAEGIKVTTRAIKAKAGVGNRAIQKYYKSILADLSPSVEEVKEVVEPIEIVAVIEENEAEIMKEWFEEMNKKYKLNKN